MTGSLYRQVAERTWPTTHGWHTYPDGIIWLDVGPFEYRIKRDANKRVLRGPNGAEIVIGEKSLGYSAIFVRVS